MQASKLPFFSIVRVSGDDRATFLHGQLSNHIEGLAQNQACYATYNNPKGRVIANMLVLNRGDDLLLVLAQDLAETVIKKLKMYVLRAKVTFESLNDFAAAGQLADGLVAKAVSEPHLSFPATFSDGIFAITLPHDGVVWIGKTEQLPTYQEQAENAWKQHEIASGFPWISEVTKETCVAQMLNQHQIGGVHFRKGCYPGQEIIARAQYRGQVKRGLAILTSNVVQTAGAPVQIGDEEVGLIINTVPTADGSLNLAVVKHSIVTSPTMLNDAQNNPLICQKYFFETE